MTEGRKQDQTSSLRTKSDKYENADNPAGPGVNKDTNFKAALKAKSPLIASLGRGIASPTPV
jgi:hypothetical protein